MKSVDKADAVCFRQEEMKQLFEEEDVVFLAKHGRIGVVEIPFRDVIDKVECHGIRHCTL